MTEKEKKWRKKTQKKQTVKAKKMGQNVGKKVKTAAFAAEPRRVGCRGKTK